MAQLQSGGPEGTTVIEASALLIERSKESRRLIANFDEVMRELRYSAAASTDEVRARHCCSSHAIRSQARSGLGRLDDQAREAGAA